MSVFVGPAAESQRLSYTVSRRSGLTFFSVNLFAVIVDTYTLVIASLLGSNAYEPSIYEGGIFCVTNLVIKFIIHLNLLLTPVMVM